MKLSQEAINEFQRIYKQVHGKSISYEDASDNAIMLIRIVKLLLDKC